MTEDIKEFIEIAVKIATVVVVAGGAVLTALSNKNTLNSGRNKSGRNIFLDNL